MHVVVAKLKIAKHKIRTECTFLAPRHIQGTFMAPFCSFPSFQGPSQTANKWLPVTCYTLLSEEKSLLLHDFVDVVDVSQDYLWCGTWRTSEDLFPILLGNFDHFFRRIWVRLRYPRTGLRTREDSTFGSGSYD